jgi:hypothetical protein
MVTVGLLKLNSLNLKQNGHFPDESVRIKGAQIHYDLVTYLEATHRQTCREAIMHVQIGGIYQTVEVTGRLSDQTQVWCHLPPLHKTTSMSIHTITV